MKDFLMSQLLLEIMVMNQEKKNHQLHLLQIQNLQKLKNFLSMILWMAILKQNQKMFLLQKKTLLKNST